MHHSLILLDVKRKYSGAYTCIATNKAGQSICTATVEVSDGKSLLQHKHILYLMFYTVPKRRTNVTGKEINQLTTSKPKSIFPRLAMALLALQMITLFFSI